MTTETHPVSPAPLEAAASRRDFVAAAVTIAAAGGAATGAQAQDAVQSALHRTRPACRTRPATAMSSR